jgi:membrane-associated protease RseP (regulator of RpoE activity)
MLPLQRISPFTSPLTDLYEVNGPLSVLPADTFWFLANLFYWIFWINLMLGMTNALPAVPLDGGHIFRDGLDGLLTRLRKGMGSEARDRFVRAISYSMAFFVLFLFLFQILGPRL